MQFKTIQNVNKNNETYNQAQNNIYFSLNIQSVIRVQQGRVGNAVGHTAGRSSPTQFLIQAFDNQHIHQGAMQSRERSEMSRVLGLVLLYAFQLHLITAST